MRCWLGVLLSCSCFVCWVGNFGVASEGSVRVSFLVRRCVETHTLSVTNTLIGAFVQKPMYLLLKHAPYCFTN